MIVSFWPSQEVVKIRRILERREPERQTWENNSEIYNFYNWKTEKIDSINHQKLNYHCIHRSLIILISSYCLMSLLVSRYQTPHCPNFFFFTVLHDPKTGMREQRDGRMGCGPEHNWKQKLTRCEWLTAPIWFIWQISSFYLQFSRLQDVITLLFQ